MNALSPWVHALGWTLVHFLWQGLVVGAAFAAVRALLPKTHCRARYAAGLGALALLAVWPVLTLVSLWPQAGSGEPLLDVAVATPAAAAAADPWGVLDRAVPWLVAIWLAGVLAMAARALNEWRILSRIARRFAKEHADLDALATALIARFGFVRRVRVLVSGHVDTPMLFGWIKPVVLLPTAVALGFPRHQIELILAHELGHLRRYDHLVNLAQTVLETLLFYHPVVHWISNEVRNERELCCDELVLRLTDREPREYARTLASLEELRHAAGSLALAANGGELLERVRRIIGMPAPRLASERRPAGRWMLVAFGLGAALLVAQRIERANGPAFVPPRLAAAWLGEYRSHLLPASPAVLDRIELPQLRLPALSLPAAPVAKAVDAAAETVAARTPAPVVAPAKSDQPLPATPAPAVAMPVASPPAAAAAPADPLPVTTAPVARTASTPAPAADTRKPVAVHTVAPAFPTFARRQSGRVEASFSIASDGTVRDIRIVSGDDAFRREAERALRQWRFDPQSLPPDSATARFRQAFVFAPPARNTGEHGCVVSTGSRICRDIDDGAMAKVYGGGS